MNLLQKLIRIVNYRNFGNRLYIDVDENNNWKRHPHVEINMLDMYPYHIFRFGPPKGWMEFVRVDPPDLGVYEIFEPTIGADISQAFTHNGLEYGIIDGKYYDIWHVRDMTEEEKKEKQQKMHDWWKSLPIEEQYPSWKFKEETCEYEPPTPYPYDDDYKYEWNEENLTWDKKELKIKQPDPMTEEERQIKLGWIE